MYLLHLLHSVMNGQGLILVSKIAFQCFFLNALANPVENLSNAVWWIAVFQQSEVKLHFLPKLQCILQQFHSIHEL